MKDLLLRVRVVVKSLNLEISRCRSADYLRQRIVVKCVPHVQHDYLPSFIQWHHCFLALSLPLPSSLLKLPNSELKQATFLSPRWQRGAVFLLSVLACEMFTSGVRPWLKNIAYLSSLIKKIHVRFSQRNTLKCMPHVQHDNFCSSNQSQTLLIV